MAKLKPPRKSHKVNSRSRASKRATSPSINLDKSIKEIPRASNNTFTSFAPQNSGIVKNRKNKNLKSRNQRLRQERERAKAENLRDQLSRKVDAAESRRKRKNARRAIWEDVNNTNEAETQSPLKHDNRVQNEEDSSPQIVLDTKPKETAGAANEDTLLETDTIAAPMFGETMVVVDRTASPAIAENEHEADNIT